MGLGEDAQFGLGQVVTGTGACTPGFEELVLGVEHVEQAALTDVELLAVGVAGLLGGELVLLEVGDE